MIKGLGLSMQSLDSFKKEAAVPRSGQALESFSEQLDQRTRSVVGPSLKKSGLSIESQVRKDKKSPNSQDLPGDNLADSSQVQSKPQQASQAQKPERSSSSQGLQQPQAEQPNGALTSMTKFGDQAGPALLGSEGAGVTIPADMVSVEAPMTLQSFVPQVESEEMAKNAMAGTQGSLTLPNEGNPFVGMETNQASLAQDAKLSLSSESEIGKLGLGAPVFSEPLKAQQDATLSSNSSVITRTTEGDLGLNLQNIQLAQQATQDQQKFQKSPVKMSSDLMTERLKSSQASLESLTAMAVNDESQSLLKPLSQAFAGTLLMGEEKSDQGSDAGLADQPLFDPSVQQPIKEFSASLIQESQNTGLEPQIQNMKEVVDQTRAMINEGGGEMQIHLQPEGLGKIQLKVAVQDGRVQVEMMTDNNLAKKALEEGLFEVKSALESQRLLVDTLKVDMSPDYQKDFTDMRDHLQEQANREFAQDFMEQFRQDRQARMGGLMERFQQFEANRTEPELKLNRRNPYADQGKGRTLNLVA